MGNVSLEAEAPSTPEGFEHALARAEFELKRQTARRMTWLFSLSNLVVLLALMIVYGFDQSLQPGDRLITTEVIMALIGATTVQVGAIMYTIMKSMFPTS